MMRGQGGGVVGREAGWWSDTKEILTYCGASSLAKARIVTQEGGSPVFRSAKQQS